MLGHDQCFTSQCRGGLEELNSFEWLLEKCANALGIPCRTFEDWHQPRFAMPQTRHLLDKQVEKQKILRTDNKIVVPESGLQIPTSGKRRVEIELDRVAAKTSRSDQPNEAEVDAFVQNIINKMPKVDL